MNKKLIILIVIAIVLIGAYFMFSNDSNKETLSIEDDLAALELTDEEKQALADEGIELPSDSEADLSATNLDDLDAALDGIDNDLLGL